MSFTATTTLTSTPIPPRKRTSSFYCSSTTNTRPTKAPRTNHMGLSRTQSFLCLSDATSTTATTERSTKAERERRRNVIQRAVATTATRTSSSVTPVTPKPKRATFSTSPLPPCPTQYQLNCTYRSSSPLSPNRTLLPGRPIFPRSKQEPDLHRQAIIARMRGSPDGQKILHMGPKHAFSIISATRELERLVAAQGGPLDSDGRDRDNDVIMGDTSSAPVLSSSWVFVPCEESGKEWEMVDCSA